MKILICGGHLTPALGLIEALPKNVEVLYAGRKYAMEGEKVLSLEYQTIRSLYIPFAEIKTGRIQRVWTKHTIPSFLKLPIGFFSAFKIIKKFEPDVVIGFGGYVSVPLCIIGYFLRIPIVLHEQTFEAGLANKLLARIATRICISWKESATFFSQQKTTLTGNPAVSESRVGLTFNSAEVRNDIPKIVIAGGSQGSHFINQLVEQCVAELLEKYEIFHQTGDTKEFGDFDRLQKIRQDFDIKKQKRYTLVKFIHPKEIITVLRKTDLVISRAGMNTVTELLLLQKPSLLIPLLGTQNGEQVKNALFFKNYGLGEILLQNVLTREIFLSLIHAMIENKKRYANQKDSAELMIHKDAAKKIVEILQYVQKNSSQKEN